jgi:ribosomal protein L22
MTEEYKPTKTTEKKEKKAVVAKPLPVDKEKTKEIEEQMKKEKTESKQESEVSKPEENISDKREEKPTEKKEEKKDTKKVEIKKKEEAIANGISLPISKKHAMYIGRFIKGKKIDDALADLEKVVKLKKAVPFKGEIPHRKGNMERGRYPVNAAKYFINLLKGLKGNVITNQMELDDTKIYLISPSWASRPMRRGGVSAKRTNVIIKAKEFPIKTQNKMTNKEHKK